MEAKIICFGKLLENSKFSPHEGKEEACPEFKSDTSMKNETGGKNL